MNIKKIQKANTKYLGKNIIYIPETTSTQEIARQMAEKNAPNGTMVITDFQTSGKGTKGRKWLSNKEKNIMLTLIIYPNVEVRKLEGLTLHIAEAIQKAIQELYGYELTIKEPNDLLFNGKKIAGILTQSTSKQNIATNLYIGIGFNVNDESLPEEIRTIATSLKIETHQEFEREEIITAFLEKIEKILNLTSQTNRKK